MSRIVIFGATSAIAAATAKRFAANGGALCLVARDPAKLAAVAADLHARGAQEVVEQVSDLADCDRHEQLFDAIDQTFPDYDTVLVAHGSLGNQAASERDYNIAAQELETNFLSVVSLLTPIANRFAEEGRGTIAVITSVAGDRGRQSNYIYGAAKGGLSLFLQGLRNRLWKAGVSVITVKPGFVDTPMTSSLRKGPLWVGPDAIAKGVHRAIEKRRNVVYLPWFWLPIMVIIKMIPESIFKRLSL